MGGCHKNRFVFIFIYVKLVANLMLWKFACGKWQDVKHCWCFVGGLYSYSYYHDGIAIVSYCRLSFLGPWSHLLSLILKLECIL